MNITKAIRDKIIELYDSGLSMRKIQTELGCGSSSIHRTLKNRKYLARRTNDKVDLTLKRFGRWLVIKELKQRRNKRIMWECLCDCGNTKIIQGCHLTQDKSKSCGCLVSDTLKELNTTHGKSKSLEYHMYCAARHRAKKQNVPFTLKLEDIVIPEFCPVFPNIRLKPNLGAPRNDSPSLDKIVPSLGYTKENSRVISQKANSLKKNATIDELKRLVIYMENQPSSP